MNPPEYFEKIRQNAARRWEQLDTDPELAGPWHQLFKQVQSPLHVLSEMLQNADDAGATKASAEIVDGEFVFEHNGGDFTAEQFASLCRFAFSNKQTLHTIGFRGVGFKSTFSLGDNVEVITPSLAVRFHCARFTLPIWIQDHPAASMTTIRVRVADQHRLDELAQSLRSWSTSPASLLFFRNLQELEINGRPIKKARLGVGAVPGSEVVTLTHAGNLNREKTEHILVIQSEGDAFPPEAVREIRKERNITDEQLPPCTVELVYGISSQQRLYVILPTGASLELPFSINAPFLQDPARFGIKEPSTSPTNRWLLERAGKLAAAAMASWVGNAQLSLEDRAKGYGLLPKVEKPAEDSNGRVTACLREAFFGAASGQAVVLQSDGEMAAAGACFGLPQALHGVWSDEQLTELFGSDQKKLLSHLVAPGHRTTLHGHGWLKNLSSDEVFTALLLENAKPPRPATWVQLHALWSFVCANTNRYWDQRPKAMKLVPVVGENSLQASPQVIRLPERRGQLSDEDWKFVTDNALAIDGDWLEWLSQREAKQEDPALVLLREFGLAEATAIDKIVTAASRKVFQRPSVPLEDCVRFAQILAALGATAPADFQYATRALRRCALAYHVIYEPTGAVEDLAPAEWGEQHILHDDYTGEFKSCTGQAWETWVASGKSGLHATLPIVAKGEENYWGRYTFEEHLRARGTPAPRAYPYSSGTLEVADFSFDPAILEHWNKVGNVRLDLHAAALANLLKGPAAEWKNKLHASAHQNGRVYKKPVNCDDIPAEWIVLLRSKRCLKDTHGYLRLPSELLLRTPDTEALRDIEPFVTAEFDTAQNRPLLDLLGVRSTPSGTKKIIERLEALSRIPNPAQLVIEISKLYEALDRIVARCAPPELQAASETFEQKSLILSESGEWVTSGEVSIFSDEGSPSGSIHHLFQNLSMWPRLGISERPAVERSLEWLRGLPAGERVEVSAVARVRSILRREPQLAWKGCQHWLSLDLTWEPVERLANRQTKTGIGQWDGLVPAVKRSTADLRMLSEAAWQQAPFAGLRELGDVVNFEITEVRESGGIVAKPWLTELGKGLCRVKLEDEQRTLHVRAVAERLLLTRWRPFSRLEVTPYVDGVPAGAPLTPRVIWRGDGLFVAANASVAKLHKDLAEEVARPFNDRSVAEAITACIERDAEYVADFLADQFELEEQMELPSPEKKGGEAGDDAPNGQQGEESRTTTPGKETPTETHEGEDPSGEDVPGKDDPEEKSGENEGGEKPPRRPTPPKPDLMDRYAANRGFKWHAGEKCYTHQDGRWIERAEAPFHWVEKSAASIENLRIWVQEQTLAHGIELPAEVWSLIRSVPQMSALLVKSPVEAPVALGGEELIEMQAQKLITLYPARYRIVETAR